MAGLDSKLGGLIASVQHVGDSLDELKRATQTDHDKLITLDAQYMSDRKTIFNRIEKAEEAAANALLAAKNLVDALREELSAGVKTKSDRVFHVLLAIGGVATSLLTAWLMVKFGLAGGGSHASHGG